jgi:uroporphyrinogen-III decarboxylase
LEVLQDGTPEQTRQYSMECIKTGVDVLNAGCAWPVGLNGENIVAMVNAAKTFYK